MVGGGGGGISIVKFWCGGIRFMFVRVSTVDDRINNGGKI